MQRAVPGLAAHRVKDRESPASGRVNTCTMKHCHKIFYIKSCDLSNRTGHSFLEILDTNISVVSTNGFILKRS